MVISQNWVEALRAVGWNPGVKFLDFPEGIQGVGTTVLETRETEP